jgi:hypothetical protein
MRALKNGFVRGGPGTLTKKSLPSPHTPLPTLTPIRGWGRGFEGGIVSGLPPLAPSLKLTFSEVSQVLVLFGVVVLVVRVQVEKAPHQVQFLLGSL